MTPGAQEDDVQTIAAMFSEKLSTGDVGGEKAAHTHTQQEEIQDKDRELTATAPESTNAITPRNSLQMHRTDHDRSQRLDKDLGREAGEGFFPNAAPSFEVVYKGGKSGVNQ